jgi:O-antigen ligase
METKSASIYGLRSLLAEAKSSQGSRYIYLLLCVAGLASLPLVFASSREYIDESLRMYANEAEVSPAFTMVSRFLNAVIGVLLLLLTKSTLERMSESTKNTRNIVFGIFFFAIFNYGVSAFFGEQPGFPSIYLVLGQIALVVLVIGSNVDPNGILLVFKYIASTMVLGSICAGVVFPDFAYMGGDVLLSADFGERRLIGFFSHPSLLGIYALLLFAVEFRVRFEGWRHWIVMLTCVTGLIMSTSKTGMVLAIFFAFWSASRGGIIKAVLAVATVALISVYFINTGFLTDADVGKYSTLTGRTGLWTYLIDMWMQNPIFGIGPAYFSNINEIGFAHAHNIFLQALIDGGLLGLLGLLVYVFTLIAIGLRNASNSNSLSISLVVLMVIFSMSEPIMRINSFVGNTFFVNGFMVLYLCALDRQRLARVPG